MYHTPQKGILKIFRKYEQLQVISSVNVLTKI